MVGPGGEDTEESFDILVCTPLWLIENRAAEGMILGKHMMIAFRYKFPVLESRIRAYCSRCSGEDWEEVVGKLRQMGSWEFEDYQPYKY